VFRIAIASDDPGQFKGRVVLRALFDNGSSLDVMDVPENPPAGLVVTQPKHVAIGSVRWQLVRLISTAQLKAQAPSAMENRSNSPATSSPSRPNPTWPPRSTRSGVEFVRENTVVGQVNLLNLLDGNDLDGTYLTGNKVQPVVLPTTCRASMSPARASSTSSTC